MIAYFLSRPQKQNTSLPLTLTIFDKSLPLIFMMTSSLPPIPFDVPLEALNSHKRNYPVNMLLEYQSRIIQKYGDSCVFQPLGIHPKYPYSCLFSVKSFLDFPQEVLDFLWYLCDLYTIGIQFQLGSLYEALINHKSKGV